MAKRSTRDGQDAKYLGLVRSFPLRPIRSDGDLDRAINLIDSLVDRDNLEPGEDDYLEVLSDLVLKYEAEHDPIAWVSDADLVRYLLESNGMSQADLAERSRIAELTISEVVAGKRKLSRRHIAAVASVFRVSPSIFFAGTPELETTR